MLGQDREDFPLILLRLRTGIKEKQGTAVRLAVATT